MYVPCLRRSVASKLTTSQSDPGDAFNQFWNVLQGMLDNISQPVAFATAPLNTLDIPSDDVAQSSAQSPPSPPRHTYPSLRREHGAIRESDDDHLLSRWTKKIGLSRESSRSSIHDVRSKGKGGSSSFDEDEFDEFLEEGKPCTLGVRSFNLMLWKEMTSQDHSS